MLITKPHIRFDWAAKKMLRDKANFGILEGFLSELLKDSIKIKSILESESNKENSSDKYNRVDLLVQNSKDELIIIEIQNTREIDFLYRLLFITSKTITENIYESDSYSSVVKVITISVLYFDLGQGDDYIYHGTTNFVGLHSKDFLQLSENQRKIFQKENINQIFPEHYLIRISKFDENKISLTQDKFDEWVYFLKTSEIKEEFSAQGIVEARKKLSIMNLPREEQRAYQYYLDKVRTEASIAETIKFEKEWEFNKGIKFKQIEMAKEMKKHNEPIEKIMQYTGLSKDDIEKL